MRKFALDYDATDVLKFVYDFDADDYEITTDPMTYYDTPYHSHLAERIEKRVGDDFYDHKTVQAYFLLEEGDNALDYTELPAMTIACKSDIIPTIVNAFKAEGYHPLHWYNALEKTLVDIPQGKLSYDGDDEDDYYNDEDDDDENSGMSYDPSRTYGYSNAPTMKFVYDEDNDHFEPGDVPQTYYDRPHHSDLMERAADHTGNWDMDNIHSGYLYLAHSSDNAITWDNNSVTPGTIASTIPPSEQIIDHFRKLGYPVNYWLHRTDPRSSESGVLHEIPQKLPVKPPTQSKLAAVPDFSLIKFVSLPDKFLVGENTHHAYLLSAEYGSNSFPAETGAIGRAWLEDDKIHGVAFDFGTPDAQKKAIDQLGDWAREQGYDYSPNMEDHIIGLAHGSTSIFDKIEEVAESLQSVDYGQTYWNPSTNTVFYNVGDADDDDSDSIKEKFLAIPEVEHVELGDESGPPGGWYQVSSTDAPTAFVFSDGHMYYGLDHAQIIEDHDAYDGGLYGRLHERSDGRFNLELYSDYDKNQTKEELDQALPILSKSYDIAEISDKSIIPEEDMAEAEQYFV